MNLEWMADAACLGLAEVFESRDHRPQALHICLFHCPVRPECAAWTDDGNAPLGMVQAGQAWAEVPKNPKKSPTPLKYVQPALSCRRCVEERLAELTALTGRQLVDN